MPKALSLKKGKQQSITNFFKAGAENNVVTKVEVHCSEENKSTKRKASSPLKSQDKTNKNENNEQVNKKHKLEPTDSKNDDSKSPIKNIKCLNEYSPTEVDYIKQANTRLSNDKYNNDKIQLKDNKNIVLKSPIKNIKCATKNSPTKSKSSKVDYVKQANTILPNNKHFNKKHKLEPIPNKDIVNSPTKIVKCKNEFSPTKINGAKKPNARVPLSPVKNTDLNKLPSNIVTETINKLSPSSELILNDLEDQNDLLIDLDFGDFVENFEELDLSRMQRCEISDIKQLTLKTELKLKDANNRRATCIVEGNWRDTPLVVGEKVSVIASPNGAGGYTIDNCKGLLVLRPDYLMSSTSIVGGVFCQRKAILQDTFRGIGCANEAMTIGTLVHELVQKTLTEKITNAKDIQRVAENILKDSIPMLYDAGLTISGALNSISMYIPPLVEFMKIYFLNNLNKTAGLNNQKGRWNGHIDELLDIEENVCCPELGVKGKIDATLQVTIHENKNRTKAIVPLELKTGQGSGSAEHRGQVALYGMMLALQRGDSPASATDQRGLLLYRRTKAIVPLELKTGQGSGSAEHRGQVVLYGMMLALQRGDSPASAPDQRGLLLYLRDKVNLQEINLGYSERRDLVMLRNQLVQYLADPPDQPDPGNITDIEELMHTYRQQLPDPVRNERACGKCPYLTICSIYLWNTEGTKVSTDHPLSALKKDAVGHLSRSHIDYFLQWAALLKVEEKGQMMSNPLHCLWTESAEKRARRGVCFCNLQLKSVEIRGDRFLHTFIHISKENIENRGPQAGEFSIVSIDNRPWIAAGMIASMDATTVSILLERDISRRYSKVTLYHIDSYESHSSSVQNLTNIGALMDDTEEAGLLRSIIIDKKKPEFEPKLHREVGRIGVKLMKGLNRQQQKVILKALTAKHYMLLQGLPGTGKTQTISVLIQMLVALKQRVLVTAHTHSAVDTVLTRLPKTLRILRLGSSARVNPAIVDRCEDKMAADVSTPEELGKLYSEMEVVGVTCLGSNHGLLAKHTFDVCIVDEATQVLQSTVIRPLLAAKRFVLVGDPDQLPPVVRSPHARRLGMEKSLFSRLIDTGGTEILKLQYRMNSALTIVANKVAYHDALHCATDAVRDATIMTDVDAISDKYKDSSWIVQVCSKDMNESAIFVDTGHTGQVTPHKDKTKLCVNKQEVYIVLEILNALKIGKIKQSDIGIIAPYRDQVSLLRTSINKILPNFIPDVSTVDQFQGKDKSVIIYSCTKTTAMDDKKIKENEVLNDSRRLAVAVTRAKHKLIVIGDSITLRRYAPLERLIDACATLVLAHGDHTRLTQHYQSLLSTD